MAPKKGKGKKRASSEDGEKNYDFGNLKSETTDLLSPSEVVKMRKKTRTTVIDTIQDTHKELKANTYKAKTYGKIEGSLRCKREKLKDPEKKLLKKFQKDKQEKENENKKTKIARRSNVKKKLQDDDYDDVEQVLYPCGICTKEVSDADDAILCEAGCEYWYHRNCTGMTDIAYELLTNEENAEWVCDKCIATKSVPLVKIKSSMDAT